LNEDLDDNGLAEREEDDDKDNDEEE